MRPQRVTHAGVGDPAHLVRRVEGGPGQGVPVQQGVLVVGGHELIGVLQPPVHLETLICGMFSAPRRQVGYRWRVREVVDCAAVATDRAATIPLTKAAH
jgi:hypothetical protein